MGASSVGSLAARLTIEAADWNRGFDQAQARMQAFGGYAKGALSFLGAPLSVAGLVAGFNHIRNEIDETAKTARKLGLEFGELQALRLAATHAGVDEGGLTASLGKLSRNIGGLKMGDVTKDAEDLDEVGGGANKAAKAFGQLGLSAKDFEGKNLSENLLTVVEALEKIQDPGQRGAVAFNLLGKQANAALMLAANGAKDTKASMDAAFKLPAGAAKGVEEFNDAMATGWQRVKTIAMGLAAGATLIYKVFREGKDSGQVARELAATEKAAIASRNKKDADLAAAAAAAKRAEEVGKLIKSLEEEAKTLGLTEAQKKIYDLKKAGANKDQIETAQELAEEIDYTKRFAEQLQKLNALKEEGARLNAQQSPLRAFAAELEHLNEIFASGALEADAYDAAVAKAVGSLVPLQKVELPGLLQEGSAGAVSAFNQQQAQAKAGQDRMTQIFEILANSKVIAERGIPIMERIARNTEQKPGVADIR